jgi:ribosome-associated protein
MQANCLLTLFRNLNLAIHDFPLQGEFIELNVLLKLLGLASSGGAAKALIVEGAVRVDQKIETRIRRKLHAGDVVKLGDETIRIIANGIEVQ